MEAACGATLEAVGRKWLQRIVRVCHLRSWVTERGNCCKKHKTRHCTANFVCITTAASATSFDRCCTQVATMDGGLKKLTKPQSWLKWGPEAPPPLVESAARLRSQSRHAKKSNAL